MTFLSKKEVYELLNDFNIIYFKEKEFEGKTAMGKNKHWHVFYIIAQKIKQIINERLNKKDFEE